MAIRDHAAELAGQGPAALADRFAAMADRLAAAVPTVDPERPVPVWRVAHGATTAADYLRTRVVEVVVHADDLACSIGLDPAVPPEPATVAFEVFVALARARSGDAAVLRAFTRAERADPDTLRAL